MGSTYSIIRIAILLSVLIIPVAYAQIDLEYTVNSYLRGSQIDLKFFCSDNGTLCDSGIICNTTINSPNGDNFIKSASLDYQGEYVNITIPKTRAIGLYSGFLICSDGVSSKSITYIYKINPTLNPDGNTFTTIFALALIAAALLILAFILSDEHIWIKVPFLFVGIIISIYGIPIALFSSVINSTIYAVSLVAFYLFLIYTFGYIVWYCFMLIIRRTHKRGIK